MLLSQKLIGWYKKNKRDLPFRNTTDAYKIWLSEIIFQQTRIEQGLDYYNRFILKFSDVNKLARANQQTVLKLWQGLGYYSRARNLHHTSKIISSRHKGVFPASYTGLLKLKGIGAYTAAAIASFAYNLPHAVVDGNVVRVLSRLFAVNEDMATAKGKKIVQQLASQILDPKNAALHNNAIMELGALVCKPQNPLCPICPVAAHCLAFKLKTQALFPVKQKKPKIKHRYFYYLVIEHNKKFLLRKRTANDIWKNMYDFPLIETKTKSTLKKIMASHELKILLYGNPATIKNVSHQYKHVLSHQIIHAVFIHLKCEKKINAAHGFLDATLKQLKTKYALPRLIEKYMEGIKSNC